MVLKGGTGTSRPWTGAGGGGWSWFACPAGFFRFCYFFFFTQNKGEPPLVLVLGGASCSIWNPLSQCWASKMSLYLTNVQSWSGMRFTSYLEINFLTSTTLGPHVLFIYNMRVKLQICSAGKVYHASASWKGNLSQRDNICLWSGRKGTQGTLQNHSYLRPISQ